MNTIARVDRSWQSPLRHHLDAVLVMLSVVHACLLLTAPSIPLVALALWWNANTIAHNFIHQPFFRSRALNRAYSCFLSVVLGFPQTIWRQRHLAHHAGRPWRMWAPSSRMWVPASGAWVPASGAWVPALAGTSTMRLPPTLIVETALVLSTWGLAATFAPETFFYAYLPGWALGLALCSLQGHYEHARGTTSHYGRLYNFLFFNDGYHVEHHEHPGCHWTELGNAGANAPAHTATSRWPPILRWMDAISLDGLERIVLCVPLFQRVVIAIHARAFRRLLQDEGPIRSVVIVGGGLFPRTALVLKRILPHATLTIVDASAEHLSVAAQFLDRHVITRQSLFAGTVPANVDLVVVPLAFIGDRRSIYAAPPARLTLVHDWLWHKHGASTIVSVFLLKRLNLLVRSAAPLDRHQDSDGLVEAHSARMVRLKADPTSAADLPISA